MAGGILNKLFGRPAPPPEVAEAIDELRRVGAEHPSLAGPVALLSELLPVLAESPRATVPPFLSPEQVAAKLAGGVPLLRGETVPFDAGALSRRWADVCAVVARHQDGGGAAALAAAVKRWRLSVGSLAASVLAGQAGDVHSRADALEFDAGLTATVLRFTLSAFLVPLGAAVAPLRSGAAWGRGYCPTCGSWPLLGEFRGLEQVRWLRCGLCAADWEFPRLACPFCDNRDPQRLGFLHVEGEEGRLRAATCEECRGHVKMVATLGRLGPWRLLAADAATLYLDLAAAERGYAAPGS